MALHAMLSAMKELILNADPLPESVTERRKVYEIRFPELSSNELEDLAALPPGALATYSNSIFSGERGIIQNHFRISLMLLDRGWQKLHLKKFSLFEYMKGLHRRRPWKSYRTEFLLEIFARDLQQQQELLRVEPALSDCAEFEYINFLIKRIKPAFSLEDYTVASDLKLETLSVEELLSLQIVLAPFTQFLKLGHDINSIYSNPPGYVLEDPILAGQYHAIGARDQAGLARWAYVPEQVFELLKGYSSQKIFSAEEIAQSLAQSSNASSEQALFIEFLTLFSTLIANQALLLVPE